MLAEFDDNKDGVFERAEAYEYGAGDLKTKTTWYDDWALDANGEGEALADQTIDRALTVADENDDGTGESSRHDKYDAAGALVVESLFDDDHDGTANRAEAHEHDGGARTATRFYDAWTGTFDLPAGKADRVWTYGPGGRVASVATRYDDNDDGTWDRAVRETKDAQDRLELIEFDDDGDDAYDRAEAYAYDAAGVVVRTDFYGDWDEAAGAAGQHADRSIHVMQDYDDDGSADDSKTETFDDGGRAVRVEFDYGSDNTVDRIKTYAFGADTADARWLTLSDDFDADGNTDLKTAVTHHGSTEAVATRRTDHDDGSGGKAADDGTFDKSRHEVFDAAGALVATKHDDDGDGVWERRVAQGRNQLTLTEFDDNKDGVWDRREAKDDQGRTAWIEFDDNKDGVWDRREAKDGQGRAVLIEFDDDKDGSYERAEGYAWSADAKVRTDFYGDWDESKGAADQHADKSVHVMQDYDGDGSVDDSKTETFDDGGRAVRVAFDYGSDNAVDRIKTYVFEADTADARWLTFSDDFDADGTIDLKTAVTYHGATDKIATRQEDHDDGSGGKTADDGEVDKIQFESFDADGGIVFTKHDDDADGNWDRTLVPSTRDKTDVLGRVILTEFDDNGDGTFTRAEAYTWDIVGAKVRTDFYGEWVSRAGTANQFADKSVHVMRNYDGSGGTDDSKTETFDEDGRAVRVEFDYGSDNTVDRVKTYVWNQDDDDDLRWQSLSDDFDADGTTDVETSATYHGTTAVLETRRRDYDDGSGGKTADDGVVDRKTLETFDADGKIVNTKYDDDADGAWDHTKEPRVRDTKDDDGRLVVLREFDDGGDGRYERAEAYAYGDRDGDGTNDADHGIRTDFYDGWDDSFGTADLPLLFADRSAHFRQDYDGDGGTDDSKTETFDRDNRAVWIEFDHDSDGSVERVEQYAYEGADKRWKHYWSNEDATADDVFERRLTATREADGRIGGLDAGGSLAGVKLDDVLAGNTGMLTVAGSLFDDAVGNEEIEGGAKDAGTLGTGQTFNLSGGMDTFTVRSLADTEDAFDGAGDQIKSAPRLTVDAGEGADTIIAPIDVAGAIAVDGGKGDDTLKLVYGSSGDASGLAGHFIRFDGGPGDDTLLVEEDAGGGGLAPRARIANIENIELKLGDTGANGSLTMRLFVADGFSDAVKVTGETAESLTTADLNIRFALAPGVDGGSVDLRNVSVTGFAAAGRPAVGAEGGPGDDVLTGAPGATVFGFRTSLGSAGGADAVRGYNSAEGDAILIVGEEVKDDSTTVTTVGPNTVVAYTLVDGAGAETGHSITVEGVSSGVKVTSETSAGPAEIAYRVPPPGRAIGPGYDEKGRLTSEGFDDDDDGALDRYEIYSRDSDDFINKREIEYEVGAEDGFFEQKRLDTYSKGVLTSVKHDLDADGAWDIIDTYSYPDLVGDAYSIQRVETMDTSASSDDRTVTYRLHHYHGGDGGDGRVGGIGSQNEWFLPGPGDDVVRGGGGADWFIVEAGDGEDSIVDFSPTNETDRIWIREEGVAFGDLAFADASRTTLTDSAVDGVVVSWGGDDRLWLPGHAKADMKSDFFLFGDDFVVVPDSIGQHYIRGLDGRTTEVRYYEGWDGAAGFGSLDPERIQKYSYEGDDAHWTESTINSNPFRDGVFEYKVTVERYGNGLPISRLFEFDDAQTASRSHLPSFFANDGETDRRRRDFFDEHGRIAKIITSDDDAQKWRFYDTYTYDEGDGLHPRGRMALRTSDNDEDGDPANAQVEEPIHLVFGTDGNDRGHAAIVGTDGDDWFIPGPGDDIVDIGRRSKDDDDVFILTPRAGTDLLGVHWGGAARGDRTDLIWMESRWWSGSLAIGGSGADAASKARLTALDEDNLYEVDEMAHPVEALSGESVLSWVYKGLEQDRLIIHDTTEGGASWTNRLNAPSTSVRPLASTPVNGQAAAFWYGSRNSAWTLDDEGRVTEIRFFDAWNGVGDPSYMNLAPDRVHRYTYDGADADWTTQSKNENALTDDVFEYLVTVERDGQGRITKETIGFDDGRGSGANGGTAGDGIVDRRQENVYDAGATPPRITSSKYDHDLDRAWDVQDAYSWDASVTEGPNKVTRTVDGAADPAAAFIYGGDGDDTEMGTSGVDWIDAGKGDDDITGGGGADVFIFRYGDGTDVIQDFQTKSDTIWIRVDGFDPSHVEATLVALGSGGDPDHPYIPESLRPGSGTRNLTVLTYGGGEEDRLIIVGGTEDADAYRAHFAAHAGHIPDFGGG